MVVHYDEESDLKPATSSPVETPVGSTDYMWFEDATDGRVKKCLIDDMPGGGGGGGGAPDDAEYLVKTGHVGLSDERVVDDDQVEADWGTAGHVKFKLADIANDTLLGFDSAFGGGGVQEVPLAGGLEFNGGPGLRRSALTGDVTASAGSNSTTIANNAVTDAKLRDSGAMSVIGRSANSSGDPADISASTDQVLRESGGALGFGTVATGGIAGDAVTDAKLRNSGALSVIGRSANSSGDPADISASAASGAVLRESGSTIGFGTVATAGIANSAVTYAKIQDQTNLTLLGNPAALTIQPPSEITLNATLEFSGTSLQRAALTGPVTATAGSNTTALTNDGVTNAALRNSGALSVIGRSANSTGDPADISASAASDAVLRESGSTVGFGTVATGGLANNAVTDAKIRQGAALTVIGRSANSTGNVADIQATAAADGVLRESGSTIGFGKIATGGISADAVTNTIIRDSGALSVIGRSANSSGDPADISATAASGAVLRESGSTLGFGTIATAGIANNAVDDTKLRDGGACSVIGRSANSSGDPADISAGSNNQILQRVSNALTFTSSPDNLTLSGTGNDLGGLSACKGRMICVDGQVTSSGAQTIITAHFGDQDMDTVHMVFPCNLKVVGVGVNIQHNTGSNPGAWTVHVKNETAGTECTKSCSMANGTAFADNITTGAASSDLAFTAGDRLRLWMDGPSATSPRFRVTIFFVTT